MNIAVIGAGFGDEGKGHVVDYLASKAPTVVVRYNGGAQAGHTVVAEGKRHVFGHFGAGTLAGAPTFLSRFFIVNPMVWRREWTALRRLGITPKLFIDPRARLTTPYDMLANQVLAKHGTCGLGIHETIVRKPATTVSTRGIQAACTTIREQTRERLAGQLSIEQEG